MKLTTLTVERLGAEALREVGAVAGENPAAVGARKYKGKYVLIWQKVGGDWNSRPTFGHGQIIFSTRGQSSQVP